MSKETKSSPESLTPDDIQKLADKVYDLWRRDLQIANERQQLINKKTNHHS